MAATNKNNNNSLNRSNQPNPTAFNANNPQLAENGNPIVPPYGAMPFGPQNRPSSFPPPAAAQPIDMDALLAEISDNMPIAFVFFFQSAGKQDTA
ncbi:hypothetical protein Bca52824_002605 [Brassica carinata]|uniref:Uncharacterized protein n=1 Tax=Brassica carinata TaxID=52824 RepID=A0A8X7WMD7_BRACI|nr:hypothetical protein Bca52824_002605 [Brassica carinata]